MGISFKSETLTNSTLIPVVTELRLVGVFEPGVPNRERIVLKVETRLDIGMYAIVLGRRVQQVGHAAPMTDSMYWIGSGTVEPNDWFYLFTGSGTRTIIPPDVDHGKLFVEFWGRPLTVFQDGQIVPMLWRLSGATVERSAPELPASLPQ